MISDKKKIWIVICLSVAIIAVSLAIKIGDQITSSKNILGGMAVVPSVAGPDGPDSGFLADKDENPTVAAKNTAEKSKPTGIPGVTASAYLVGNVKTGEVYLSKNAARVQPVASMSKLVTAFVATDIYSGTTTIPITAQAVLAPADGSNLVAGEHFTLDEILKPLLLSSSNVAAEAISSTSSTTDRAAFMELMRSYAWEVGMPHSFFADPSGVSPDNVASAEDMFGLAKYLMYYRPDVLTLTRMATASLATTTDHGLHQIVSTHPFVSDPRFIGGKTGRTAEAGETMLTILDISDQPIAIIILGASYGARESDTRILLEKVEGMVK